MVMVDAGVTQFFQRLDIGPLDIGDFLGTCLTLFILISYLSFSFLAILIYHLQQLGQFLLQQILFAHCRYGILNL